MAISERLLPAIRKTAAVLPPLVLLVLPIAASAQLSLSTAVAMAEKSSPRVRSAVANVQKATAALEETKDIYIPNFNAGGSPGYFYGFPMGYPSLFSINTSSMVLSFSQPDYIRAAHQGLKAARLNLKDVQDEVALDAALDYIELDHDLAEIAALDQEKSYASSLASEELARVQAGIDPRMNELQAQLTAAQVDEKRIHLENDADEMRQKLEHLTGLPGDGMTTVSSSIPAMPLFSVDGEGSDPALAENPGLSAAYSNAKSKLYEAFGDARQNYRPLMMFGAQYSRFAQFNNYSEYFQHFQYNNFGAGIQITLPFFDAVKRAKSRESAADARAAEADADQNRDTLTEQDLLARRSIRELQAQQRVAQIETELAQEQLKTINSELTNGSGSPGAQPVAPTTADKAHIDEREKYEDLLDTNFSLMKVQLNLMRMTGQITDWVSASLK